MCPSIPFFKRRTKIRNTPLRNASFKSNGLSKIDKIFDFTAKLAKIQNTCISLNSSLYEKNKYVSHAFK
jgi:hypothetical protein